MRRFRSRLESGPTHNIQKTGDRLHNFEVDYRQVVNAIVVEYYRGVIRAFRTSTRHTLYRPPEFRGVVCLRDWLEADVRSTLNIPYNAGVRPCATNIDGAGGNPFLDSENDIFPEHEEHVTGLPVTVVAV